MWLMNKVAFTVAQVVISRVEAEATGPPQSHHHRTVWYASLYQPFVDNTALKITFITFPFILTTMRQFPVSLVTVFSQSKTLLIETPESRHFTTASPCTMTTSRCPPPPHVTLLLNC